MKNIIIGLLLLIGADMCAVAQDSASIRVRYSVQQDAVLLRWGADTPYAWKKTNRSGFRIERYTVSRGKEVLVVPEKKVLVEVLKALPLQEWIPYVERDDNAGIIAQALYGEDFQLTGEDSQGFARMINMAQELDQRFTFSLYAADQNFDIACLAGWGYKDTDVKKGERYLYRIVPATYEDSCQIRLGSAFTGLDEYRPLPRPQELAAVWNNKCVMLAWNYSNLADVYNSYYIEKSVDGKKFTRIEGRPVSSIDERQKEGDQRLFYVDSLSDDHTTFYYRIRGISTFGELGPVSDTLSGKGVNMLPYVPVIRKSIVNDKGELEMEWQFENEGESFIEGFQLRMSDKANGIYRTVADDISPSQRSLKYDKLNSGSYFVIKAVALEGESRSSYPVLIQPLDTVPPAVPLGLQGKIDSLGIVKLSWNPNTESDLLGYLVYRAFTGTEEAVPVVKYPVTDTCYIDTVDNWNLNPVVYYYLVAVDQRYNQSDFSERLDLVKPDFIPPVSPVFSDYHIGTEGVELKWICSPSEDVREHRLYRKEKETGDTARWVIILPGNQTDRYRDTSVQPGKKYAYTIFAVDKSGLVSLPTPALNLVVPGALKKKEGITRLDAVVDKKNLLIKLVWKSDLKEVKNYEIYKSEGDAPYTLWKVVAGWQRELLDEDVAVSMQYRYMIRALFENGGNSRIREIIIKGL